MIQVLKYIARFRIPLHYITVVIVTNLEIKADVFPNFEKHYIMVYSIQVRLNYADDLEVLLYNSVL